MDKHIIRIIQKTKYLIYIFHKLKQFMSTETLRMIYYEFFKSIIPNGYIAWGGAYNSFLNILQSLENRHISVK